MNLGQACDFWDRTYAEGVRRTVGEILAPWLNNQTLVCEFVQPNDVELTKQGVAFVAELGYRIRLLEASMTLKDRELYELALLKKVGLCRGKNQ